MPNVGDLIDHLESIAPLVLAAEWDNVGLLLGDCRSAGTRIMTCLTLTPEVVEEAIQERAELVVTHHPLPFRPLKRITTDTTEGDSLWRLARAGVSVYSPHTAFDSAMEGINQQIAERLGLTQISPLTVAESIAPAGTGRMGEAPPSTTLDSLVDIAKRAFGAESARVVGESRRRATRIAVACGSGGSLLELALQEGCDAFVTGEATFHNCLIAKARGIGLVLVGHYASERFAIEWLATCLADQWADLTVWASREETDPLRLL